MKSTEMLVSEYLESGDYKIKRIAEKSGIMPVALYGCASGRKLKADELLKFCDYMGVDPMRFLPQDSTP